MLNRINKIMNINKSDIVYEGELYCRKISKGFNRHWSSWKTRNCIIKNNGTISIRNSNVNDIAYEDNNQYRNTNTSATSVMVIR